VLVIVHRIGKGAARTRKVKTRQEKGGREEAKASQEARGEARPGEPSEATDSWLLGAVLTISCCSQKRGGFGQGCYLYSIDALWCYMCALLCYIEVKFADC
jgi:hypothetical protein